jgi:acyl-CoA synthetase (AMP-forming)/AMP-acid ligase II
MNKKSISVGIFCIILAFGISSCDKSQKGLPKIAEDGEILIRHGGIFQGYFKEPETTAQALEGGWFHTGSVTWVR